MCRRRAVRFNLDVTAPADIDGLSLAALKALVVQLLSKVAEQEQLIADLREENAQLKGLNGRPRIKPRGRENAGETKPRGKRGKSGGGAGSDQDPRVAVEDRVIRRAGAARLALQSAMETYVVHDVVLRAAGGALPAGALDHAGMGPR